MNTFVRTLIVWLVLLAVPFQGFASAAMLGCATGHASAPASSPGSDHPQPAAPVAASLAASAHDHAMHGAGHAHHGAEAGHAMSAPDAGDGQHTLAHHGSAKCGACSACTICTAMAPAPALALPVHAPPALTVPFAAGHLPAVDLALPERPPRPILA